MTDTRAAILKALANSRALTVADLEAVALAMGWRVRVLYPENSDGWEYPVEFLRLDGRPTIHRFTGTGSDDAIRKGIRKLWENGNE